MWTCGWSLETAQKMALESSLVGGVRVLLEGRMGGRHGVGSVQKLGLEGRKKSGEVLFSVFSSSLSFPPVFCMAYRSWLPDQRLNLCLLSLSHWTAREVPGDFFEAGENWITFMHLIFFLISCRFLKEIEFVLFHRSWERAQKIKDAIPEKPPGLLTYLTHQRKYLLQSEENTGTWIS